MDKIKVKLIGEDGNIFNLVFLTVKEMKKHNLKEEAEKLQKEVFSSKSYDEALQVIMSYVDVI